MRAIPAGPTCHTGATSCFAPALWRTITQRAAERPDGSYTTELLDAGIGAVARKVGEEAVEVTVAALDETDGRLVEEAADLIYHLYVLLAARGIDLSARSRTSLLAGRLRRLPQIRLDGLLARELLGCLLVGDRREMITSSPCFQFTGVATLCFAVSCSESITRSISSKLRPVSSDR